MAKKILVIGSANTDIVIHTDKMPILGETYTGKDFSVNAGGKGLNQAIAIGKLGGNVTFLGAMGQDGNAQLLRRTLSDFHVPSELFSFPDHSTGVAIITVVNGDNFILLHPGANQALTPEKLEEKADLIARCDYLVLQLEIPLETVIRACEIAQQNGAKVILNPAPYTAIPNDLLAMIDYLIPNEHEAYAMTGIYPDTEASTVRAIRQMQSMGAKNVVITQGARGCTYTDGADIRFCPAIATDAVDTTSAGDSFIGGFVTKIASGFSVEDGIRFGTKVASITVGRHGAAISIPYADEIAEDL